MLHIRPNKPTENAYVESFHGRLRDECLNTNWFWNLFDARRKISTWQHAYNVTRPHSAPDYKTPNEFEQQWQAAAALLQPIFHTSEGLPDQPSASLRPDRQALAQLAAITNTETTL